MIDHSVSRLTHLQIPNAHKYLWIAGPCSVESQKQIGEVACALKNDIHVLRGGIWKPRTSPGTFEGFGAKALPWLKKAAQDNNLLCATEVASPKHVEQALSEEIDILWIGARTTVNPFMVQEIADALAGVDVPVFIKNPIHPDVKLWVGAVERFKATNCNKLGLIHRGFASYADQKYRNRPHWNIAIEIKRLLPALPLFIDPSHIAGNRELIPEIMQRSLDLDYDGGMIEVHPNPEVAMSDANQQLSSEAFLALFQNLIFRSNETDRLDVHLKLEEWRKKIDQVDVSIVQNLMERMNIAQEIGVFKKSNELTILQIKRWENLLENMNLIGTENGLSSQFVEELYNAIHKESIRRQEMMMK